MTRKYGGIAVGGAAFSRSLQLCARQAFRESSCTNFPQSSAEACSSLIILVRPSLQHWRVQDLLSMFYTCEAFVCVLVCASDIRSANVLASARASCYFTPFGVKNISQTVLDEYVFRSNPRAKNLAMPDNTGFCFRKTHLKRLSHQEVTRHGDIQDKVVEQSQLITPRDSLE